MHAQFVACVTVDLKNSASNPLFVGNFSNIFECIAKVLDTILTTTNCNSNIIQLAKRNWHVSLFSCRKFGRIKACPPWNHMVSNQTARFNLPVVFGRVLHDQITIFKLPARRQLGGAHVLDING